MRIDVFLTKSGFSSSRTEAKNLICSGAVQYRGVAVTKPSFDVPENTQEITVVRQEKKYASRGGFKLESAINEFNICVSGVNAIDVGASSGGFTDCLLQSGAKHVYSVDSGSGQIAEFLRNDERVTVYENYNARYMKRADFAENVNFAVMDVSFISATYIIPAVYNTLCAGGEFVCLIKPQFEVGRKGLGKGGIVKNEKLREDAVKKVVEFANAQGFLTIGVIQSPITGGDGNIEYLAYFRK